MFFNRLLSSVHSTYYVRTVQLSRCSFPFFPTYAFSLKKNKIEFSGMETSLRDFEAKHPFLKPFRNSRLDMRLRLLDRQARES